MDQWGWGWGGVRDPARGPLGMGLAGSAYGTAGTEVGDGGWGSASCSHLVPGLSRVGCIQLEEDGHH